LNDQICALNSSEFWVWSHSWNCFVKSLNFIVLVVDKLFWWILINLVKIMNWWVIVVETCLNLLHECLFMFVCWWGLNWCGCLWVLNEKWENCGFWWKLKYMMNLRWIDVMIQSLLWFWMPFDVCKLIYKFLGRIWGQGDQNGDFGVKVWKFLRGNNQNRVTCSSVARCSKLHRTDIHVLCRSMHSWSIRTIPNRFFWCT